MVVVGEIYSKGLAAVFGNSPLINGPWVMANGFPMWAKIATACVGTFCAPVAEELFFRGALFGSFAGAGHVKLGMLVSALAFAAVHMDMFNFVILFVMGAMLAYIYHKTGSLAACMTAHAVNNGLAFLMLFTHHG
jgi:membrane protease YdiL (CAAX protease family)